MLYSFNLAHSMTSVRRAVQRRSPGGNRSRRFSPTSHSLFCGLFIDKFKFVQYFASRRLLGTTALSSGITSFALSSTTAACRIKPVPIDCVLQLPHESISHCARRYYINPVLCGARPEYAGPMPWIWPLLRGFYS